MSKRKCPWMKLNPITRSYKRQIQLINRHRNRKPEENQEWKQRSDRTKFLRFLWTTTDKVCRRSNSRETAATVSDSSHISLPLHPLPTSVSASVTLHIAANEKVIISEGESLCTASVRTSTAPRLWLIRRGWWIADGSPGYDWQHHIFSVIDWNNSQWDLKERGRKIWRGSSSCWEDSFLPEVSFLPEETFSDLSSGLTPSKPWL